MKIRIMKCRDHCDLSDEYYLQILEYTPAGGFLWWKTEEKWEWVDYCVNPYDCDARWIKKFSTLEGAEKYAYKLINPSVPEIVKVFGEQDIHEA